MNRLTHILLIFVAIFMMFAISGKLHATQFDADGYTTEIFVKRQPPVVLDLTDPITHSTINDINITNAPMFLGATLDMIASCKNAYKLHKIEETLISERFDEEMNIIGFTVLLYMKNGSNIVQMKMCSPKNNVESVKCQYDLMLSTVNQIQ